MILALDTSTLTLSLALVERTANGFSVLAEETQGPPARQSDHLPGAIGALLERMKVPLPSLDAIVVGLGPGSFTGLRLGLATAKGLAYAAHVPLLGASSLEALALDGPEGRVLLTAALARRGEVYAAAFSREGSVLTPLWPARALSHAEFAAQLASTEGALGMGPAVTADAAALLALGAPQASLSTLGAFPRAARLVERAPWPARFELETLFALEPHYVGVSGAERNAR